MTYLSDPNEMGSEKLEIDKAKPQNPKAEILNLTSAIRDFGFRV